MPGFNIGPSQSILVVRYDAKAHERVISGVHWGLIPHFAKDPKIGSRLINARAETVDRMPSYRVAFVRHRCLVPVDGFFEWQKLGKRRQPYAFALESREPCAIAGLWENWKDPATGAWIRSCALITTTANELVAPIHDRMPVIIEPQDYARWLGEEPQSREQLQALLRPYAAAAMVSWPVSQAINKPGGVDDSTLLDRVAVEAVRESRRVR